MASMIPTRPAMAMSMISARFCGQRRTRSPTCSSTPKAVTLVSGAGSGSSGFHSLVMVINLPQATNRSMSARQLLACRLLGSFQQATYTIVRSSHFALLFVGQRHHAKGQHLVHFRAIEEIARALRRNLRIVIKNDRRTQHHVVTSLFADQHRKTANGLTLRCQRLQGSRRIHKR